MLKPHANLIEQLVRHDQRTGFTYGDEPRFEMREKPLLHHFSSSFLPDTQNRAEGRSCGSLAVLVGKRFRFPARFTKRTGPALIHNQLVDRSLQTNVCHETSCYEF